MLEEHIFKRTAQGRLIILRGQLSLFSPFV